MTSKKNAAVKLYKTRMVRQLSSDAFLLGTTRAVRCSTTKKVSGGKIIEYQRGKVYCSKSYNLPKDIMGSRCCILLVLLPDGMMPEDVVQSNDVKKTIVGAKR